MRPAVRPVLARLPRGLPDAALDVVRRQDGVATVAQLQAWDVGRSLIGRRVEAGDWQRPFRGVVVLHSGHVSWRQRARAALLYCGEGAALSHRSAAYLHGFVAAPGPDVVVSVPRRRAVSPQPGLVVHRPVTPSFAAGRLRVVGEDDTVLDLLDEVADEDDVVAMVCDAVRCGVLPGRVLLRAEQRPRLRSRALLLDLLDEVADGVESPLERRYARDVERAHGLPAASAQVRERVGGRWIRADRVHRGLGVRIELDGELAHPHGRTDDDVWRDNAALVERGDLTLRYRWRHVTATPCRTAAQVGAALAARGWTGDLRRCAPACPAALPPPPTRR